MEILNQDNQFEQKESYSKESKDKILYLDEVDVKNVMIFYSLPLNRNIEDYYIGCWFY